MSGSESAFDRMGRTDAESYPSGAYRRNVALVAKGSGIMMAGRSFAIVTRFALAVLMARLLGAEQNGLFVLTVTAATLASGIALFGLDVGLVRYVAAYVSRRDASGLWGTLHLGIGLPLLASLLSGLGLAVLSVPIADNLFHEPRLIPLLQLSGLAVPFLTLIETIAAATRGFKNVHYTVIAHFICQPFARTVAVVALALAFGLNAGWALAAFIFGTAVASILLVYFLNKQFTLRRPLRAARYDAREILSFSLPSYLSSLIGAFSGSIQMIVLGSFTAIANIGIFSVASQADIVNKLLHSSVTTAAMPVIAELYDRNDRSHLARLYQLTSRWTFSLVLPSCLVMILYPQQLLSIFGESYVGGAAALTVIACADLVGVGAGTCGAMLEMTGHTRLKLLNSIVAVSTTIGLNLLLIPQLGLMGAALAALVGGVIVNSLRLVEVFIVLRILPYCRSYLKPILASLAAIVVSLASGRTLDDQEGLVQLAVQGGVLVVAYGLVILALGLEVDDRALLVRLFRRARTVLTR